MNNASSLGWHPLRRLTPHPLLHAATCLLACSVPLPGCGASLPMAPEGPHRPQVIAPVMVDYPPPSATVECIPPQPDDACVWLDGHYEWARRGWQWVAGGWIHPPPGCYYAPGHGTWLAGVGGRNEQEPNASPSEQTPPEVEPRDEWRADEQRTHQNDRLYYVPGTWYPRDPAGHCEAPRPCGSTGAALEC